MCNFVVNSKKVFKLSSKRKLKNMKKLLVILFVFSTIYGSSQEETTHVKLSDNVPAFDFEVNPGIKQNIADLNGKLVLITFFATWCAPCRQELPHIQSDIYNKYKNNPNFRLLVFGREHNWEEVNKFKAENRFSMPFYPDPDRTIYSKFAGQYIPRNFLISPDGKVLFSSTGFDEKNFRELKELIESRLKKK
jgi:thiol-disulfide isomerase/thioredoxin